MDNKLYNATYSYDNKQDILLIQKDSRSTHLFIDYAWYKDSWIPVRQDYIWHYQQPMKSYLITKEDLFSKAFKIAKILVGERLIVSNKQRDFMKVIELISKNA